MLATILFFLFSTVAVVAAIGMLVSRNPVNSALWLVLTMFCVASLYLTLHAAFLAVVQILVYAGAIMVLFLFVIMLLNLGALPRRQEIDWVRVSAVALGVIVLAQVAYAIAWSFDVLPVPVPPAEATQVASASELGKLLFSQYAFPVEMMALLLLAATIGAVILAKRRFM